MAADGTQGLGRSYKWPEEQPTGGDKDIKSHETPWYAYAIPLLIGGLGIASLVIAGKCFDISPDALIAVGSTAILASMIVAIILRVKSKLWEKIEGEKKEKVFQIAVIVAMAALIFGMVSLPNSHINLFDRTVSSFTNNTMADWITFGVGSALITGALASAGYIFNRRNKEEEAKV